MDTVHSRRVTVSHGEKNGHAVTRREGKSQKFDLDSTMVDSRPSSTKTHGVSTAWSRCITVSSRWVHGELTASHGEVHGAVTVHHGAPRCVHGEPRCLHGAFTVTTARSRCHTVATPWGNVRHREYTVNTPWSAVVRRDASYWKNWLTASHGAFTVIYGAFTVSPARSRCVHGVFTFLHGAFTVKRFLGSPWTTPWTQIKFLSMLKNYIFFHGTSRCLTVSHGGPRWVKVYSRCVHGEPRHGPILAPWRHRDSPWAQWDWGIIYKHSMTIPISF